MALDHFFRYLLHYAIARTVFTSVGPLAVVVAAGAYFLIRRRGPRL